MGQCGEERGDAGAAAVGSGEADGEIEPDEGRAVFAKVRQKAVRIAGGGGVRHVVQPALEARYANPTLGGMRAPIRGGDHRGTYHLKLL
jgi:hypothetical protein